MVKTNKVYINRVDMNFNSGGDYRLCGAHKWIHVDAEITCERWKTYHNHNFQAIELALTKYLEEFNPDDYEFVDDIPMEVKKRDFRDSYYRSEEKRKMWHDKYIDEHKRYKNLCYLYLKDKHNIDDLTKQLVEETKKANFAEQQNNQLNYELSMAHSIRDMIIHQLTNFGWYDPDKDTLSFTEKRTPDGKYTFTPTVIKGTTMEYIDIDVVIENTGEVKLNERKRDE